MNLQSTFRRKTIYTALFTAVSILTFYLNKLLIYQTINTHTNLYLFGISVMPYFFSQAVIQSVGKIRNSFIYDKNRQGKLGQKYVSHLTIILAVIIETIFNISILIYNQIAILPSILFTVISAAVTTIWLVWSDNLSDDGLIPGVDIIVAIQAISGLVPVIMSVKQNKLIFYTVILGLFALISLFQNQTIKLPVMNLKDAALNQDKMYIYLPLSVSGIIPVFAVLIIESVLQSVNINSSYKAAINLAVLFIGNLVYSVINTDPAEIADTLQERNSYLVNKQNKIILAGKKTEKYLRKQIYKISLWYDLALFIVYELAVNLDNLINKQIGLPLVLGLMLIAPAAVKLVDSLRSWWNVLNVD